VRHGKNLRLDYTEVLACDKRLGHMFTMINLHVHKIIPTIWYVLFLSLLFDLCEGDGTLDIYMTLEEGDDRSEGIDNYYKHPEQEWSLTGTNNIVYNAHGSHHIYFI
ncbi:hypothetical protein ACJX0J_010276, partial [Zea mays]